MWTRQSLFSNLKETFGGGARKAAAFLPDFRPTQKATFEFSLYFPLSRLTMVLTVWMEGHLRKEQQSRWPARAEILSRRTHSRPVDYASVVTRTKTTTQLMTSVCHTGHEAAGPFHVYIVLCRFIIIHAHIIISSLLNNKTQRLPRKVKLSRASSFEYPSYTSGKGNLQMIKKLRILY
jgi:hypothetical protein